MKTDFENIGKKLPYAEDADYVARLVERTTEEALRQQSQARTVSLGRKWTLVAAAAAVLLLGGVGLSYYGKLTPATQQVAESTSSPVDDFLNSLSDEDAGLLAYYAIEEIPEYE